MWPVIIHVNTSRWAQCVLFVLQVDATKASRRGNRCSGLSRKCATSYIPVQASLQPAFPPYANGFTLQGKSCELNKCNVSLVQKRDTAKGYLKVLTQICRWIKRCSYELLRLIAGLMVKAVSCICLISMRFFIQAFWVKISVYVISMVH